MTSRQRQTADAVVAAFNTMDIPTIISLRAPTCERRFLPSSLNYPSQSNSVYEAQLKTMAIIFTDFKTTVNDVIEDLGAKKIVMYVSAEGNTPVGVYKNEYVWKLEFNEAGEKIVAWSEFVDVGIVRDFYPRLAEGMKKRAEETGGAKES